MSIAISAQADPFSSPGTRLSRSVLVAITALRNMIVTGELPAGSQVRQGHLAERLGMSRVPVREALSVLANEGVLTHVHNSGYRVARLNRSEFDQIYFMRDSLESSLLERLQAASPGSIRRLDRLNEDFKIASNEMDIAKMVRINYAFHFAIYSLARMPLVEEEIHRLWARGLPYQTLHYYTRASREKTYHEHQAMVECLRLGDRGGLVAQMRSHRGGSEALMEELLPVEVVG